MHSSKYLSLLTITSVIFLAGVGLASAEVSKPAESKSAEPSPKRKSAAGLVSSVPKDPPEKAKIKSDEAKEGSATYKVESKPLKIIAKLTGVVESKLQTPVSMDLDRWTELSIVSVLPHGTEVKKGDILFQLETKALEKKIRELEVGMPLKELDLETAKQELEKMGQTTPLQLEEADLAMRHAKEDLDYFFEVTKPMRERSAQEDLKSSENYLSYAEEELRQLKKMYDEDDMTEETEEIILQRQQNSVDNYRWVFEQTKARTDRTLNTSIPREEESLKRAHVLKEIDFASSEKATKDSLIRKELDVEAKVRDFDETELAFSEYRSDLKQMAPKAPHDGLVYYGMSQRGKWTTAATIERKMIPGGKLSMNEVAVTIVDPNDLHLRLTVPENKLKGLKPGLGGTLKLEWNPDLELQGKVESVSRVPYADNTYDAVVSLPADVRSHIVPGMKASVEVVIYDNEKTLVVPKNAIEKKGKASIVTMASGEKRRIRTGQSSGSMIEVVEGLKVDDEIRTGASEKDVEKSEEKVGEKK